VDDDNVQQVRDTGLTMENIMKLPHSLRALACSTQNGACVTQHTALSNSTFSKLGRCNACWMVYTESSSAQAGRMLNVLVT
jgi:hypothetical protein